MSGSCGLTNNMNNVSLYQKMMYGGMGYDSFCVPKELPNYIMLIVFPPLSVFIQQWKTGFKRVDKIIICFILTSFFYFPGLLYGLNELSCGGLSGGGGPAKCGPKLPSFSQLGDIDLPPVSSTKFTPFSDSSSATTSSS
jgi:uncharacterized membrane protein YqaE (UPF0057 family)